VFSAPKKRVFISFAHEDRPQINGLRLLAANPDFDIEFYDESLRVAIDSTNAAYIRSKIRDKINRTSVTVCMIGETTYQSTWVDWELRVSLDKGNAIIAMGIKGLTQATLPMVLRELKYPWYTWDYVALGRMIKAA
jgi:hypothetical protein